MFVSCSLLFLFLLGVRVRVGKRRAHAGRTSLRHFTRSEGGGKCHRYHSPGPLFHFFFSGISVLFHGGLIYIAWDRFLFLFIRITKTDSHKVIWAEEPEPAEPWSIWEDLCKRAARVKMCYWIDVFSWAGLMM